MLAYVIRRILYMIPTLFGISLIALLIKDEDRVPRALIDECAGHGQAMVERLAALVAPDRRWSDEISDGEWWLRLHAVMILGLMFFPLGVVGTLAKKGKLPRIFNWD